MTDMKLKALKLRRARLDNKSNTSARNNENIQENAKKFSTEWRKSIVVKPVAA